MTSISQESTTTLLTLDDGKANAVSHALIETVYEALDQAAADSSAIVIAGRPGLLSGGFDLKEFEKGPEATTALVNRGAHMLLRLFSHPQPVVIACTGHAIAAGAFLLLAADTRIGAEGAFKIGLNETAIGMTLPVFGLALASNRLSKRHQTASVVQSHLYDPAGARDAGFLDEVVSPDSVIERALAAAHQLGDLPAETYGANKLKLRAATIESIRTSLA